MRPSAVSHQPSGRAWYSTVLFESATLKLRWHNLVLLYSLFAVLSAFAETPCRQVEQSPQMRVAWAHHFVQTGERVLSLRVSASVPTTSELLRSVGCAIVARYPHEQHWHALVFSDFGAAKRYQPPLPGQKEPPEFVGACSFNGNNQHRLQCGPDGVDPRPGLAAHECNNLACSVTSSLNGLAG